MTGGGEGGVRLAELLVALSFGTDLAMGQPPGHAVRTCRIATALGRRLGVPEATLAEIYHVALLRFVGCTADAHELATFAGDEIVLAAVVAPLANADPDEHDRVLGPGAGEARSAAITAHCEAAVLLAERLGLGGDVVYALRHGFERWDGHGHPRGVAGEGVPLSVRVAGLARDAELWHRDRGAEGACEIVRRRRGRAYDPVIADAFLDGAGDVLASDDADDAQLVLVEDPAGIEVPAARLDELLTVAADYADVKLPLGLGHSRRVAELAAGAARELGLPPPEVTALRHAGLVHDLGRAGVSAAIWGKPRRLSADEWERVRLHAYLGERILARSPLLRPLAPLVGAHHERADGSGYHRGIPPRGIAEHVLAAADAYQGMRQDRPHRPGLTAPQAADALAAEANDGRLDPRAVEAVLGAAGQRVPRLNASWPSNLTDREVDVLRLACRGSSREAVAGALRISPKTVSRHLENAYAKIGVTTRAAAALYAVEHNLL